MVSPSKILFGPGRLFFSADLPLAGENPAFTDGEPEGGIEVGSTYSSSVSIKPTISSVMVEQAMAPVDAVGTKVDVSIEAAIADTDIDRINEFLATSKKVSPTHLTSGTSGIASIINGVVLVHRRRDNPAFLTYFLLYRAWCDGGIQAAFSRERGTEYRIKINALADLTPGQVTPFPRVWQSSLNAPDGTVNPPVVPLVQSFGGSTYGSIQFG